MNQLLAIQWLPWAIGIVLSLPATWLLKASWRALTAPGESKVVGERREEGTVREKRPGDLSAYYASDKGRSAFPATTGGQQWLNSRGDTWPKEKRPTVSEIVAGIEEGLEKDPNRMDCYKVPAGSIVSFPPGASGPTYVEIGGLSAAQMRTHRQIRNQQAQAAARNVYWLY